MAGDTDAPSVNVRDTADVETPARTATSFNVTTIGPPAFSNPNPSHAFVWQHPQSRPFLPCLQAVAKPISPPSIDIQK
jgi:hypothetical protein